MCKKIFSAFYLILHETFSILYKNFNLSSPHLVLYDRKHFCSILTNLRNLLLKRWLFLFHQKFPLLSSNLKNVLTKHFPKMQLSANTLQNRCHYKFLNIHKKRSVLESLFNKVTGLMACSFIKKETPAQVFSCEYKVFENGWRISKSSFTWNKFYDSTNMNV